MSDGIEEWKKANEYDKIREYLKNTHPDVLEGFGEWNEEQEAIKRKEEITLLKANQKYMIGFYKENYTYDEIKYAAYPSFERTNHHGLNYVKQSMIEYIESLPVITSYRGVNSCSYTARKYPEVHNRKEGVYYTDGEFTISSITLLHIEMYEITLPQKFVDRAERANYDPVQVIKECIWENQDEIVIKLFNGRVNRENMMKNNMILTQAMSLYKKERSEQE